MKQIPLIIKIQVIILTLTVLCLCACSNVFETIKDSGSSSSSSETYTITADFTNMKVSSLAADSSRSAFPVNDTTSASYLVFRMSISGTSYSFVAPENSYTFSFNPNNIESGNHTVTFYGFKNNEQNFNENTALVSGSQTVMFKEGQKSYSIPVKLETEAACLVKGTYKVNLNDITNKVSAVSFIFSQNGETKVSFLNKNVSELNNALQVRGGVYLLTVLYYSANGSMLFSGTDTVTIWPYLTTTETWNVGNLYSTYYVRGTDVEGCFYKTYKNSISGLKEASNNNTGGIADPFADVQTAVNSLESTGATSGTIYVDGIVTAAKNANDTNAAAIYVSSSSTQITIASMMSGKAIVLAQSDDSYKNGSPVDRRVIMKTGSAKLILKGLTIKNGYMSDSGGAGIYVDGPIEISKCTITNNTGTGGNIYINKGTCTLYNEP